MSILLTKFFTQNKDTFVTLNIPGTRSVLYFTPVLSSLLQNTSLTFASSMRNIGDSAVVKRFPSVSKAAGKTGVYTTGEYGQLLVPADENLFKSVFVLHSVFVFHYSADVIHCPQTDIPHKNPFFI